MRKPWMILALTAVGCAALLNLPEASGQGNQGNTDQARIARGYQIAPVPLRLKGRNVFGKMLDRDLRAVYEYLSTIPSIGSHD